MNLMTRGNQTGDQLLFYRPGRTCHKHPDHRLLDRGLSAPASAQPCGRSDSVRIGVYLLG